MRLLALLGAPASPSPFIAWVVFVLSLAAIPVVSGPSGAWAVMALLLAATCLLQAAAVYATRRVLDRYRPPRTRRGLITALSLAGIGGGGLAAFILTAHGITRTEAMVTHLPLAIVDGAVGWLVIGSLVTGLRERRAEVLRAISLAHRGTEIQRQRIRDTHATYDRLSRDVFQDLMATIVAPLERFLVVDEWGDAEKSIWAQRLRDLALGPVRSAAHALHPLAGEAAFGQGVLNRPRLPSVRRLPVLSVPAPVAWIIAAPLPGALAFLLAGASATGVAAAVALTCLGATVLSGFAQRRASARLSPARQWLILLAVLAATGAATGATLGLASGGTPGALALTLALLLTVVGGSMAASRAWEARAADNKQVAVREFLAMHVAASSGTVDAVARAAQASHVLHSLVQSRLLAAAGELTLADDHAADDHGAERAKEPVRAVLCTDLPIVAATLAGRTPPPRWETAWDCDDVSVHGLATVPVILRPIVSVLVDEAIGNARRHGGASQVWVIASRHPTFVRLDVLDNGRGFSPHPQASLGSLLFDASGAEWHHQRVADARTRVRFELPLTSADGLPGDIPAAAAAQLVG